MAASAPSKATRWDTTGNDNNDAGLTVGEFLVPAGMEPNLTFQGHTVGTLKTFFSADEDAKRLVALIKQGGDESFGSVSGFAEIGGGQGRSGSSGHHLWAGYASSESKALTVTLPTSTPMLATMVRIPKT